MPITKTELLRLAKCPNWFWLSVNEPESVADSGLGKALAKEGMAVEEFARNRFPQGIVLKSYGEPAVAKTKQLLKAKKDCLFQATAMANGFLVKADVLELDEDGNFNLYEVKASTQIHDEYLLDIAIQRAVFNDAGIRVAKCFLVILNGDYVRNGELDIDAAISVLNVTAQVRAMESVDVRPLMAEAKRIKDLDNVPVSDIADLNCWPNKADRCGCADVSYKGLPDYSVFDLARISRDDVSKLIRKGITTVAEMKPRSIKLSQQQAIQVVLTQKEMRRVDSEKLNDELSNLKYPLYFLDYETYNFALPRLDGFNPYQQYVFQYSLHIQKSPDAELQHHEYLANEISLESLNDLANSMRSAISNDDGSVIVWHRQFEESRNDELGSLMPEFRDFFRSLNQRIFDLEEVFKQQLFMHYQFKGRTSIKAILPVLCPQFSYSELNVQNGAQAMDAWYEWAQGEQDDGKRKDLLAYCELDTLAMVEILRTLSMQKIKFD